MGRSYGSVGRCARPRVGAIVLGLAALSSIVASRVGAQRVGRLSITPYVVQTEDGDLIPAALGRLQVPERRGNPQSRLIELAFLRFKATTADPGPPIIYLAGGPGGSGIDHAMLHQRNVLLQNLRAAGDVIALDQRGVGWSLPNLQCPERWGLPLDQPLTEASWVGAARTLGSRCAAFWRSHGVDLAGYTTEENADDVDAIRQALGAREMILVGGSYGSHLGLSVLRRHGTRVRRAVLWSIEGPDHTFKLPSAVEHQLGLLEAAIRRDSLLAPTMPDLRGTLTTVLARLRERPVTASLPADSSGRSGTIVIGPYDIQMFVAATLGARDHMERLPATVAAMAAGDFSRVAEPLRAVRTDVFGNAMAWHMDCASGATAARRARIAAEAPSMLLGNVIDAPLPGSCGAWGNPDLGDRFRAPVQSNVPVLFTTGTLDGRTPLANTQEVMRGFSRASHLLVTDMAHGPRPTDPWDASIALYRVWAEYVRTGQLADTVVAMPPLRFEIPK